MLTPLGDQIIVEASKLSSTLWTPKGPAKGSWNGFVRAKSQGLSAEGKAILARLPIGALVKCSPRGQIIEVEEGFYLVDLHDVLGLYEQAEPVNQPALPFAGPLSPEEQDALLRKEESEPDRFEL